VIDGNALAKELGLQGLASDLPADASGMHSVSISNLGISGLSTTTNSWYHGKGITFNDNVSWFSGAHSVNFGANFKRATMHPLATATSSGRAPSLERIPGRSTRTSFWEFHAR
jgi:hypothetical protein